MRESQMIVPSESSTGDARRGPRLRGVALGLGILWAGLTVLGCGDQGERSTGMAAAAELREDVLGFESTADWSASQGTLTEATDAVQGQHALGIATGGYTVIKSIPVGGLTGLGETATLSIKLPAPQSNPWWFGDLQMVLDAPQAGLYDRWIGQASLQSLPLESWATLSFAIPADVRTALDAAGAPVTVKLALNVPSGNGTYLLDGLSLGQSSESSGVGGAAGSAGSESGSGGTGDSSGGTGGFAASDSVSFQLPVDLSPRDGVIVATERVQVDDRAHVVSDGAPVIQLGGGTLELQTDTLVESLRSGGSVVLRDRAHVTGDVYAAGDIALGNGASIDGARLSNTALALRTAEAAGITLVAIARPDAFEIFTHPNRILLAAQAGDSTRQETRSLP